MLDKLSKSHNKWIRAAKGFCKNKQEAEDLVQDMYVKVYTRQIAEDKLTDSYVYFILLNSFRDKFKKNVSFIDIDSLINKSLDVEGFELDDEGLEILERVNNLEESDKRILSLYSDNNTFESIAEREGTYKVDIFRRLQLIRTKVLSDEK